MAIKNPSGCIRADFLLHLYFYVSEACAVGFLSGSWASTTAASISAQPMYSLPLRRSPRMMALEMVANTDSRLSSREMTVGLEPFWAKIWRV